ncbi:PQQ-dependent sugar dehydrogenase, partial [candidate division TA06 bacterium]|nr:PQQ-dependent sugar dehydrogenase [candidate division TA06 bacterium]
PNYIGPLLRINPVTAPVGGHFYTGSEVPQWQNNYFFAEWNTLNLNRIVLVEPGRDSIASVEVIDIGTANSNLDIETGPNGALWFSTTNRIYRIVGDTVNSVEEEDPKSDIRGIKLALTPPSPNPFSANTAFILTLPESFGRGTSSLSLAIIDIAGKKVRELLKSPLQPGIHHLTWDGRDEGGVHASSGIYFLLLRLDHNTMARKVTFIQSRR